MAPASRGSPVVRGVVLALAVARLPEAALAEEHGAALFDLHRREGAQQSAPADWLTRQRGKECGLEVGSAAAVAMGHTAGDAEAAAGQLAALDEHG